MPQGGETGLAEFYARLDSMHREFFSVVLREWVEAGQVWDWYEDDVSLCLRTSAGHVPVAHLICGRFRQPAMILIPLQQLLPRLGQEGIDAIVRRFT